MQRHEPSATDTMPRPRFDNSIASDFYPTVMSRMKRYFADRNLSPHHDRTMVVKTIIMLAVYVVPFVCLLTLRMPFSVMLTLWVIMGFGVAGIGMNVMHDANHGAYSSSRIVNILMGHTLNALGCSVFTWKFQHNTQHHRYTNIVGVDDDISDRLGARLSPHSVKKPYHRYQHLYLLPIYCGLTLYWISVKDFREYLIYVRRQSRSIDRASAALILVRMVAAKSLYLLLILGLPLTLTDSPAWQIVAGFIAMQLVAGLILAIVFQLAHVVQGTAYPQQTHDGLIRNNWAVHQMITTSNFACTNKVLTWCLGGLNHQIEHHLFHRVCHTHYPKLAPIVRKTAAEFRIPYNENLTFMSAIRSHLSLLRQLGR